MPNGADPPAVADETLRSELPGHSLAVTVRSHIQEGTSDSLRSRALARERALTGVIVAPPRRGLDALRRLSADLSGTRARPPAAADDRRFRSGSDHECDRRRRSVPLPLQLGVRTPSHPGGDGRRHPVGELRHRRRFGASRAVWSPSTSESCSTPQAESSTVSGPSWGRAAVRHGKPTTAAEGIVQHYESVFEEVSKPPRRPRPERPLRRARRPAPGANLHEAHSTDGPVEAPCGFSTGRPLPAAGADPGPPAAA